MQPRHRKHTKDYFTIAPLCAMTSLTMVVPVMKSVKSVLRIRIRIHRIHMFLGLPDPAPDPDPSIIVKNSKKNLDSYYFATL